MQQDMVLVNTGEGGNKDLPISGYTIACILLLFSFEYASENFPMALVWWYILSNNARCRDEATGMWLVECEYQDNEPLLAVVHHQHFVWRLDGLEVLEVLAILCQSLLR